MNTSTWHSADNTTGRLFRTREQHTGPVHHDDGSFTPQRIVSSTTSEVYPGDADYADAQRAAAAAGEAVYDV